MNEQIQEIKKELKKVASAKVYMETLNQQHQQILADIEVAKQQLEKENQDVEKLQTLSFTSILAHFSNDKEERLAQEEAQAMRAALHLKQLQANQDAIEKEMRSYETFIAQEKSLQERLKAFQTEDIHASHAEGQTLRKLMEDMDNNRIQDKELQEAIDAGEVVLTKLEEAIKKLDSASNWGMFDIFGGDLISSMVKHSKINDAQDKIAAVQVSVQRFQKELKDVQAQELSNISISVGLEMFDIVFDNIFSDFMVQNKIEKARDNVHSFFQDVKKIVTSLHRRKEENQKQYETIRKEYEAKL